MPGIGRSYAPARCRATTAEEKRPIESKELARTIAQIIDEKQGEDIAILDVSGPLVIADVFVIASGRNARHARALAAEVAHTMKQQGRLCRNRANGDGESRWALLDFGDVVVHVFQDDARAFYDLEGLWADVPRIEWTPAPPLSDPVGPDSGNPR